MTRIHLILAILATILASWLFADIVKSEPYRGDHIDKERRLDRKALRSHRCFWYGDCRGSYYKARHYRRHRYYTAPRPDSEIMAAQIRLRDLGHEIEADGFMGPETRRAVERFQAENELRVSGELDHSTRWALKRNGDRGDNDDNGEKSWSRRPEICREDDGTECTCDAIVVFSGEEVFDDAEKEAKKRWRGHVRSMLGETWMSWEKASDPVVHCWNTGTGERGMTDKANHTRCVVQARACFGPQFPEQYARPDPKRNAR